MKQYHGKKRTGRKKSIRLLSVMLCLCLLITACPYMPGAVVVHAAGGQENGRDAVIQALLDRIAALPDSEAYLAKEPDAEAEEAYAEWMEGLHQYAGEALDIQEAYEALTEEQQAQIPEEAFAKLAAWVQTAMQIAGNDRVMLAAVEPTPGVISSDQVWSGGELSEGTYTIKPGVTVTVTDTLVIYGNVTITGGGILKRGFTTGTGAIDDTNTSSIIKADGGAKLTLNNVVIDGNNMNAQGSAVYIAEYGTVTMQSGSVIQNNYNANTGNNGDQAGGGIYCEGTLQIDGGTIKNCSTYDDQMASGRTYAHAGGAIYLKGDCTMTSGSITGNTANNGGGIYLASTGAKLNLSGGTIAGNSVRTKGNGVGIYYSTLNGATSKLFIGGDGGDANVQDVIYLDITSGTLYPYIKSPLRHKITLACSEVNDDNEGEGRVLLGGLDGEGGYTLTIEDARMVSMQNTNLYSRLDSEHNRIYLSKLPCGHEKIQKVPAEGATCLAAGNKEYYICTVCVNLFSDSAGKTPTTLEAVTIAQKSHNYTYNANGAVITEKCGNGCGHTATATLTLISTSLTYTGQPLKPASIEYTGDTWVGTAPTIGYENNTNVGNATASITVNGKTASLGFTITSAAMSGVSASGYTGTYDGTAHGITVNAPAGATVEYGTSAGSYTKNTSPTYTDAGTYTVYYQVTKTNYITETGSAQIKISAKSLTADMITLASGPYSYTGSEIKPAVTVKDGVKTLTSGTDYTVSYSNNKNVGTATVTVTGKGNYIGTKEANFTITPKSLTDSMITLASGPFSYTGSEIEPAVTVKDGGTTLVSGADYTVSYSSNTDVGSSAKVTITGTGNYTGTKEANFTITPKSLTDSMITIASGPHSYTGSEIEPAVTVKDGGKTLTSGTDYTVSYSDNTSVGNSAKVAITGKGNYTGTINKTFAITAADISGATVTLSSTTLTYNGSEQTKGVSSVKIGSTTLTEGTDYTVSGNTGTDAGTYTIAITGKGGYADSTKEVTYTIEPKSLTGSTVTVASGPHYYNGSGITPAVTVKDGDKTLEKGKDYTVSYSNNINPGTATVAVTGTGNYKDTINGTFTIGYSPIPSGKSLTDYITISPDPTNGWYGSDITLAPKSGYEVGETSAGIGAGAVTISQETGTDGSTKTIYIKDGGNIYQTEFSYKLDKTPPAVDLTNMVVENGTKNLWDWIIGKKSMMIKIPAAGITETLSGVAEVSYTAESDNGTAQTKTIHAQDGYYEIALNAEFSGTIKLAVKDKAGNTTQASLTADSGKVIAEDYAPVVTFALPDTLTPNADGWYNAAVTITVAVTDNKDSNSGTILSGGIAAIRWKDGESGTVQTVADLPGNAPAYEKEFTISVNTDGTHTYYVNVVDNAGNESGWQTVTVKVDTGNPVFSGNLTVTNPTEEGADIVFTPSEGGKVYWIVSDTGTAPNAQEVKEQSGQKGGVQDITGGTENSFTITGLSAGEEHTVYVVLEDAAGNLSEVKTESLLTLQKAPEITLEQLALDYTKETIMLPDNFKDVEVYTNPLDPEHSKITPNADGLPVTPGSAVYIRYPEKIVDSMTVPASDKVKIQIPDRPDKPAAKQATVTDTTAAVKNPAAGEEYVLVKKGDTPDWSKANTTGQFTGLSAKTEYDLYVRKKVTDNSFVSEPAKTEIRTSVAIKKPVITGDGAGKDGNTAPKPDASNADGTVTFTGTYSEEYTPVIKADSQEYTPEMTWDKDSGKGGWEYTYPIPDDAVEVEITVEFRKRTLTGITAEPGSLAIYADDAANVGMETLNDYVKANCSTQATYDNKTSGTVQAAYTTTDSFEPKGGVYGYTVSAGGKTANATLTVNTVSAAATAPDKCLRNQKAGGYTEAEVAAWLPGQATVTYTGAGYTARTESRAVTWDTDSIGTDFGAETGEKTITGTVDLPAWATGQNTVSMVIEFVDKNILKDDQIQLTMPGFPYGAQTLPEPQGSITVTDTNPAYTYLYSTDNGITWVTADKLPKSASGYIIPGGYRVKMTYMGDHYIGEKTVTFSVAKKELAVLPGTLEAEDKTYDKTMNASLKEGGQPELSGVAAGDDVTLGGSLKAVFNEEGPKKDIPVTVTGFRLEGRDAGYYELKNTTLTLYADINPEGGGNVENPATKEEKPDIRIDYRKETLKGFTPGEKYKITVKENTVTITAATDGTLKLEEEWLGTTVSIVKCGNGTTKADSEAQELTIPARSAQAPSPSAVGESRPGAADGKLTGLEADKNYQISTDNGATWTDTAADKNGEITKLAPGSYIVRVSGTDSAFAGRPSVKVTIAVWQGTRPETEHKFPEQWTVEKEATEKEPGRRYKICETCGIKIYQTIEPLGAPIDPYAGKIEKEVDVLPGAPDTILNNSREELAQSILTPEEIAEVENGTDAKIWLEVAPDVDIAEEEKAQVQKAAEESVGAGAEVTYFDASLFKQVGNGAKTIIHEPGRPISVTIVIPEDIRNKDVLMVRNYHIIRLHDGKTDLIEGTYKEESAEFTFETDKFSVYAICYKDSPKQTTPETPMPTPGGTAEPGTPTPAPGGTTEPGTPTPTPEMPSKEEQTKNELTLNAKVKVSQSGRKIKVSWGKLSDADGYDVYVQYCGKKFTKKSITAVKSGKTTKVTVKKVNGKPLNLKKNYKIYVLAYKLADGKKITLGKTITAHIVGRKNTKYTNVKAVKVKKSSYRLKKGRTAQIKAKTVLVSPGKKQLSNAHAKQFRYATTNKKVATVSKKGKIKAVGKGTCTIYVYARNGYAKKIKVTVK